VEGLVEAGGRLVEAWWKGLVEAKGWKLVEAWWKAGGRLVEGLVEAARLKF
jgi:hypothetical protein